MLSYVLMLAGFVLLIKGGTFLVDGASSIARRMNVSDLVVGLTIVAFGTSSPELFVNIISSIKGSTDIAIGNVIGSTIANVFLILGISAIIHPLSVTKGTVWKEIPLSLLAALLLGILANDRWIDGRSFSALSRIDGFVLPAFFAVFMYYLAGIANRIEGMEAHVPAKQYGAAKSAVFIVLGLVGLVVGGKWIVDGAVRLAASLGMSESVMGLTIVAVGTSLPELATSAAAAYRKNVEIAAGNVVGSNIFNIFFVLGTSAVIKPLPFETQSNVNIGVVILANLLLFAWMFTGRRRTLDRWEGAVFLCLYAGYIGFLLAGG